MQQPEIGRSTAAFAPEETLVAVIEMSRSTWLVAGLVPGVGAPLDLAVQPLQRVR